MADDIIPLRYSFVQRMGERISELEAEVERLRAEMQQVRLDHITTLAELQEAADEIERLRAAVDSLLADIDTDHKPDETGRLCRTCGAGDGSWPCVHREALDELKEARRG